MRLYLIFVAPFRKQLRGGKSQAGFSFLEIAITIGVLLTLMTILVRNLGGARERANIDQTKIKMSQVGEDLKMYQIDNRKFPTSLDGLLSDPGGAKNWRGPYSEKKKLEDVWGESFEFESDGRNFRIVSAGPDGQMGSDDDIEYPEPEEEDDDDE